MKNPEHSASYNKPSKNFHLQLNFSTVEEWINWLADIIQTENICLENGMQEAYLEAEYLICYAFSITFNETIKTYYQTPPDNAANLVAPIIDKRIKERLPAAYITSEAFFAGNRFFIDSRVLIPRSRIENIFDDEEGFDGLLDTGQVNNILDLGTGSGCIAITLALSFLDAHVDASDISDQALKVAEINRDKFALQDRVSLIKSDLFQGLNDKKYDLIVSNPPYVAKKTMEILPPEYRHEPSLALAAGEQGIDLLIPMLDKITNHLNPGGLFICEVGDETQEIIEKCWPEFPAQWLLFHFGGSGVFVINREELLTWNDMQHAEF
ncbi:MAG: 50S ribosomal protein L3 N(5)-glutamine methyltransferase [Magnetococcales bacterium]|nr:50S ribosomal protein L3 N(5)-glutamine methyltransferase [Magnetococcales bacterium]